MKLRQMRDDPGHEKTQAEINSAQETEEIVEDSSTGVRRPQKAGSSLEHQIRAAEQTNERYESQQDFEDQFNC